MDSWQKLSLREAGVVLIDCVHKTPSAVERGFPYIAIPQMKNGRIDFSTARQISETDFLEWTKKALPRPHDVVLSRRTNPGVTAVFDHERTFALGQNLVLLRSTGNTVRREFLRWLVSGPEWWEQIQKFINLGAVFDSLKCADVPNFVLTIPPEDEQRDIANILSALDDKIELNRRMNETLEQMAQAIFKDWFVDFGPVRRKQEGASDPIAIMGGLVQNAARAAELAALFPEGFGDDGLPEGWLEVPLRYFGKVSLGGLWGDDDASVKKEHSAFYCLRGVDLQHLRESGLAGKTPLRFANESNVQKRLPSSRDVLVASSGAGPCGRSLWVGIDKFFQRTPPIIYSNFVKRVSCESPEAACYVDRILHNMRLDGSIQAFISGTSVPNLNDKGLLESKLVCLPPNGLLLEFLQFSLLVQRKLFSGENLSLAEARDYLLPKLMSGEVRVREAERIAEDAL